MKRLSCIMLVMMVFIGTVYAGTLEKAQHFCGSRFGSRGGVLKAIIQLNLSDSQKHEAALILRKYREEGRANFDNFREALEPLRDIMDTNGSDENAVREAFKAVATVGEEVVVHMAKVIAELKGILTPEQLEILKKRKASMLEKRDARMELKHSLLDEWIEVHSK